MPENETLTHDAGTASRWRPIAHRLDGGATPSELFAEIQTEFYRLFQRLWKQWKRRGVDPAQLFDAALNSGTDFRDILRRLANDSYARFLYEVARDTESADRERLIQEYVEEVWKNAEGELQLNRRDESRSLEFTAHVQRMLSRIIGSLIADPSRIPSQPPRSEPPSDLDTELNRSLL